MLFKLLLGSLFFLLSINAFALDFYPTQAISDTTTAITVKEGATDITKSYSFSSPDVTIIVMGNKPYLIGKAEGEKTIIAKNLSDSALDFTWKVLVIPGKPSKLKKISGDLQSTKTETQLPLPLKIQVTDNSDNGVSGVSVILSSSSSSASISPEIATSDNEGFVEFSYSVGSVAGNEFVSASSPSHSNIRAIRFVETAKEMAMTEPAKLAISVNPNTFFQEDPFSVSVKILDYAGNVYSSESKSVSISSSAYKNSSCSQIAGTILGNKTAPSINGVASFSGLKYQQSGYIYLKASAPGLPDVCSAQVVSQNKSLSIESPLAGLASISFSYIPSETKEDVNFYPQVKVSLTSTTGTYFNTSTDVLLSAYSDSNCSVSASPELAGTLTAKSSFGTATFTNVHYSDPGVIYVQASAGSVKSPCSPAVKIKPDTTNIPSKLSFSSFSTSGYAHKEIQSPPKVYIFNENNGIVTDSSYSVSITPFTDSACSIPATGMFLMEKSPVESSLGVASFSKVVYSKEEASLYFKATMGSLSACSSSFISILPTPAGLPVKLDIVGAPTEAKVSSPFSSPVKVDVIDSTNKKTSLSSYPVLLELFSDSTCQTRAVNPQSQTKNSMSGSVSFELSPISLAGNYYVKASSGTLAPSCSSLIKVLTPLICGDNYEVVNGACSPKLCSVSDVANSTSVIGNKVDGCYASACSINYSIEGGLCSPSPCNSSDFPFSSSVTGNKVDGCFASSCQNNYSLNGGTCSPTQCTTLDIPFSTAVTGNKVSGCSAISCSSGYSVQGGSCVVNAPVYTIILPEPYQSSSINSAFDAPVITRVNKEPHPYFFGQVNVINWEMYNPGSEYILDGYRLFKGTAVYNNTIEMFELSSYQPIWNYETSYIDQDSSYDKAFYVLVAEFSKYDHTTGNVEILHSRISNVYEFEHILELSAPIELSVSYGLDKEGTHRGASLKWRSGQSDGTVVQYYEIYRGTSESDLYLVGSLDLMFFQPDYEGLYQWVDGMSPSSEMFYSIRAVTNSGQEMIFSPFSSSVKYTPPLDLGPSSDAAYSRDFISQQSLQSGEETTAYFNSQSYPYSLDFYSGTQFFSSEITDPAILSFSGITTIRVHIKNSKSGASMYARWHDGTSYTYSGYTQITPDGFIDIQVNKMPNGNKLFIHYNGSGSMSQITRLEVILGDTSNGAYQYGNGFMFSSLTFPSMPESDNSTVSYLSGPYGNMIEFRPQSSYQKTISTEDFNYYAGSIKVRLHLGEIYNYNNDSNFSVVFSGDNGSGTIGISPSTITRWSYLDIETDKKLGPGNMYLKFNGTPPANWQDPSPQIQVRRIEILSY